MDFLVENFPAILAALGLAVLANFFWLFFWYHYSKKYTTPRKLLLKAFVLGILAAVFAAILEKAILSGILPGELLAILEHEKTFADAEEIILVFGIVFFLIAVPEELLKFLFLRVTIFVSKDFNQIIDGVKFGIVLALGFALVENFYFLSKQVVAAPLDIRGLLVLFLFRLFIPTLAHSLYGGILGYYFGLARFYKIFRRNFLWQGMLIVIVLHTFFNFLTLTPFNIFIYFLLIGTLLIIMKWYTDRQNFQIFASQQPPRQVYPPIFTERKEMNALISILIGFNKKILSKLGLCPFCFKRLKISFDKKCLYCGKIVE